MSSTTFVANAMAGLMLRSVGSFRPGDFVRVGETFGRVTVRGLFHTEVQTEDRDLTTVPNLHLVSQPVTVVRASGTMVSATVSLGYGVERGEVEKALVAAGTATGLEDPFLQVLELGDFSIRYRIVGFLADPKQLLSARSRLRMEMIDALHAAGIEILSPTYMVQRRPADDQPVLPRRAAQPEPEVAQDTPAPEERIFDKAEKAAQAEELRAELEKLKASLESGGGEEAAVATEDGRRAAEARIEAIEAQLAEFREESEQSD